MTWGRPYSGLFLSRRWGAALALPRRGGRSEALHPVRRAGARDHMSQESPDRDTSMTREKADLWRPRAGETGDPGVMAKGYCLWGRQIYSKIDCGGGGQLCEQTKPIALFVHVGELSGVWTTAPSDASGDGGVGVLERTAVGSPPPNSDRGCACTDVCMRVCTRARACAWGVGASPGPAVLRHTLWRTWARELAGSLFSGGFRVRLALRCAWP